MPAATPVFAAEPVPGGGRTRPTPRAGWFRERARRAGRVLAAHRLLVVLAVLAAVPRVLMMAAYRPAFVYNGDSYAYLDHAIRVQPLWGFQPGGYPLFLAVLRPFHSLALVVAVQHLLGLAAGVLVYALLRRRGLPAWGAAAAAVPVLFDASFMQLEHSVLSDTLFVFLVVAAVTAALWSPRTGVRMAVLAGLLLAAAALTRTIAVPMAGILVLALVARRAGWRPVVATLLALGLPLTAYASWYAGSYGRFTLAGGDGIALWARTMTFADCRVIKPPPDLAPLCPNGTHEDAASEYVWSKDAPINRMAGGLGNNERARAFALRAIAAQPGDYLRAVAADTALAFPWTPVAHPKRVGSGFRLPAGSWPLPGPASAQRVTGEYDPGVRAVTAAEPAAGLLREYQKVAHLRGPMLAVLLLLGAYGLLRRRAPALPLLGALYLLVGPVAVLDFGHRYVLPAVPLACVAAAMACARRLPERPVRAVRAGRHVRGDGPGERRAETAGAGGPAGRTASQPAGVPAVNR